MKGIRKVLVGLVVVGTFGCVLVGVAKFKGQRPDAPPVPAPMVEPAPPPVPPPAEPGYEEAVQAITEARLRAGLYYLCSPELEGRMSGKAGNKLAAEYIKKSFEAAGLPAMYHKFSMPRYNPGPKREAGDDFSNNIYAWVEGTDPTLKNEIVVVGAHMDHLGYGPKGSMAPRRLEIHPGADDNASGTVALMEIARSFAMLKNRVKRTVVFMAFSGEEMGLVGSKFYCDHPVFPKNGPAMSKHVAMINMDMIGYLKGGSFRAEFGNEGSSVDLDRFIGDLNGRYTFAKTISGRGAGGSDHAPFYNKRVPVVCLHTGQHRAYHTPDDTPDKINYKGLEQVARYGFELAWRCGAGDVRPVFDNARFVPMQMDHDHGEPVPFHEEKK